MTKLNKTGFTLIELLVVISVISFLASSALLMFNVARIKARDARRKSDFYQIASALELFYDKNNGYPATGATATSGNFANSASSADAGANTWKLLSTPLVSQGFMSTVPRDPVNFATGYLPFGNPPRASVNTLYHYRSNGTASPDKGVTVYSNATHYILCTWLQNPSDPDRLEVKDVDDTITLSNPSKKLYADDGYSKYNYCITR
jgi:prepilin-type N-terminal cleavage/methylation domain-containing protein